MPTALAMVRTLQWVLLNDVSPIVFVNTSAFTAAPKGGRPEPRSRSRNKPSTPTLRKRACQRHNEAEYQAMGDLKRLVDETGVAVLALHHTRKPSHEDAGTIFDTFLESSALSAGPDMLLIFDDRGDTLNLHGKGRLVEEFQLPLRWADPGFEIDEPDAALRDKAPLQYRIKSHLRQAGPCSNKDLSHAIGKPLNSVTNATGKLFYAGDIQRLPDGRFQPRG